MSGWNSSAQPPIFHLLSVFLLATYLTGRHADQRAIPIIIFATPVGKVKAVALLKENSVDSVSVKAMPYRTYALEFNQTHQRMRLLRSEKGGIVGRSIDFKDFRHSERGTR